jgi:hypothetical protein
VLEARGLVEIAEIVIGMNFVVEEGFRDVLIDVKEDLAPVGRIESVVIIIALEVEMIDLVDLDAELDVVDK